MEHLTYKIDRVNKIVEFDGEAMSIHESSDINTDDIIGTYVEHIDGKTIIHFIDLKMLKDNIGGTKFDTANAMQHNWYEAYESFIVSLLNKLYGKGSWDNYSMDLPKKLEEINSQN